MPRRSSFWIVALASLCGCSGVLGLDAGEYDPRLDTPCGYCLQQKCAAALDACSKEPACGKALQCWIDKKCGNSRACQDSCIATYGSTKLRAYSDCTDQYCLTPCSGG